MIDAINNLIRCRRDPIALFRDQSRRGERAAFNIGPDRILLLSDPALVREVLVTRQRSFEKGAVVRRLRRSVLGLSSLTAERAEHPRLRRLVQPAFHSHRLEVYAQCMLKAGRKLADSWSAGETVNISHAMEKVTLEIVGTSLFGAGVVKNSGEVMKAVNDLLHISLSIFPNPLESILRRLPIPTAQKRAIKRLDVLLYRMIAERRAAVDPFDDLLTMLVQAHDEESGGFSDEEVRNETISLLLAGHETTALTLSWAIYLLHQHPALQEELGAEADGLTDFAWDSLMRLPKLAQFVDEVVRLYPPVWVLERVAVEPVEIGGTKIARGTYVLGCQYLMQRDPRYWEDPETLRLERWGPGVRKKAQEAFIYFPFGGGARTCVGEHFARAEAVIVLASLLKKWRFKVVENVALAPSLTLHPSKPIRAVVTPAR